MTREEIKKWLKNLKEDIGHPQHQTLWHYEQALYDDEEMNQILAELESEVEE